MAPLFPDNGKDGGDEDALMAVINTTPMVDVMLVLLIIFLITVPVVIHTVPVHLPQEVNRPSQTSPRTITLAVDRDGRLYWDDEALADIATLSTRLRAAAAGAPQPEVQIRGDREVRYEIIGQIVKACRNSGILKVGFILEPPPRGG